MAIIHKIKKPPTVVQEYFSKVFPRSTFNFYWYDAGAKGKIYGCLVTDHRGIFIHNATQGTVETFKKQK